MAATVENLSQSPLAIHVKGAVVLIEAGAKVIVDDVKAFSKAAKAYIAAEELRIVDAVEKAAGKQSKQQDKAGASAKPDSGNGQEVVPAKVPDQEKTKE